MARHLPPEWAPQGAVLLIWPHAQSDWARDLERAEAAFAALALAITRFETVVLACHDEATRARALERLEGVGCPRAALTTVLVPSDDTWARDIAPLAVVDDGQPLLVECRFNGWGGKYPHERDTCFARHLLDAAGFATIGRERADLVLEGGAIDTDGAGSVLVNRNTVLDSARNPGLDGASVERLLRRHFGIERTLWIDVPPLPGDDTDGHIDTLARFTDVDTIAHAAPHDEADPAAPALATLRAQLEALRTADGDPYRLIELPGPGPFADRRNCPCPATYANFLVINDAVLVPAYADAADALALERMQRAFPARTILPVPARTFVSQSGSLHCLTMQLPADLFVDLALT